MHNYFLFFTAPSIMDRNELIRDFLKKGQIDDMHASLKKIMVPNPTYKLSLRVRNWDFPVTYRCIEETVFDKTGRDYYWKIVKDNTDFMELYYNSVGPLYIIEERVSLEEFPEDHDLKASDYWKIRDGKVAVAQLELWDLRNLHGPHSRSENQTGVLEWVNKVRKPVRKKKNTVPRIKHFWKNVWTK